MSATARAAEASRLLDVPLPSAHELESMVRSVLSTDVPSTCEGPVLAAQSVEGLDKA
jgi:hypothetical protein